MNLLAALGLPTPAASSPAADKVAASTPAMPSDEGTVVRASSGGGHAGKGAPKVRSTVVDKDADVADRASSSEVALGPRVDGPDSEQLYTLLALDGNTPLDASNSKAGARLNELGESLAFAFERAGKSYDEWQGRFTAVASKSTASANELKKMEAAKRAFVAKADRSDDVSASSDAYLEATVAVKKAYREMGPKLKRADSAMKKIQLALAGKETRSAERALELQKEKYEDRKEEIKEQQERIKGALGLMTKFASVTEWTEIIPEALAFADEQLFAELPKAELERLKKNVEEAKGKLHEAQDKQDALALGVAYDDLDAANQELDNSYDEVRDRIQALARKQNRAIKKLGESESTRDAAAAIAASRKMTELMADAVRAGESYLAAGSELMAECQRVGDLYAGYPTVVASNKRLTSREVETMSRPAKTNSATLKSWVTYLKSVQAEVKDGVAACRDKSDAGYMKHYNKIGPLMQAMLSGK